MSSRASTLGNLRAEVRQRADIENDPHISDAEVNRFVNQSGAALHALLVDLDEAYFVRSMTLTTVSGTDAYTLAPTPGVYKLLHVEALVNGLHRSLSRWTFEQRTLYMNASTWGVTQMPLAYRFTRDQVSGNPAMIFAPVPDGAYVVTVYYATAFVDMVSDSDTFEGFDGWEEWVVLDAAIKCKSKGEDDLTQLSAERAAVMQRIQSQMQNPDLDRPSRVRDVASAVAFPPFRYQVSS